MAVIDHIDGPNRDIYLSASTVGADFDPMEAYKEMRTLRRTDENLRKFELFLQAKGYEPTGGGKFTARYVVQLEGTRFIPYDTTHVLNVIGTVITDDGQSGVDCFDRGPLSPSIVVDINYIPPQVEVIEVVVGSAVTEQDKRDIIEGVWDEILTGGTHNIPSSAGRRLRNSTSTVVLDGTSPNGLNTINTISLDNDASTVDGAYDPAVIAITGGTGAGQCRGILEYNGTSRLAVVDRDWKVIPDDTSEYIINAWPGREHVNEGLAQGGSVNTIQLNALASSTEDSYQGQTVFIRSGTGEDQSRSVVSYDGITKIATVEHDWGVVPDVTSAYVMLANHTHVLQHIVDGVWDESTSLHRLTDTMGDSVANDDLIQAIHKVTNNKVVREGNLITIYEEDGTTPWKQYDLSGGGRLPV